MDKSQISQSVSSERGNSKTLSQNNKRYRKYVFTWNNYTESEYLKISATFKKKKWKFILGKEVGENKTPHIQGYVEHTHQIAFSTIQKILHKAHIEPAKGDTMQNFKYCSKDSKFETNINPDDYLSFKDKLHKKLLHKFDKIKWHPWQQIVLDIIKTKPNDRTINWVLDLEGNTGKSFLTKYLCLTKKCIIADGKKDNIFNQLKIMLDEENEPEIIILDIPRHSKEYLNYGVIEQLKNGLVYSGKYEGGMCIFDNVHIFIMANFHPDLSKFTEDRWNIIMPRSKKNEPPNLLDDFIF